MQLNNFRTSLWATRVVSRGRPGVGDPCAGGSATTRSPSPLFSDTLFRTTWPSQPIPGLLFAFLIVTCRRNVRHCMNAVSLTVVQSHSRQQIGSPSYLLWLICLFPATAYLRAALHLPVPTPGCQTGSDLAGLCHLPPLCLLMPTVRLQTPAAGAREQNHHGTL